MAIKHVIDCEVVSGTGLMKTKASVIKMEDSPDIIKSEDDAVKCDGKCYLETENGSIKIMFNRSEMLKLLRFMEG